MVSAARLWLCERRVSILFLGIRITFDKRWVHTASLVVRKGATLETFVTLLPGRSNDSLGPLGPHPSLSYSLSFLLVSSMMCDIGPAI